MRNYLIFRSDRIGDFLLSLILIKAIKRNDPDSKISILASEKNYSYIKSFPFIDEVILLPKNIYQRYKIINYLKKKNYFSILVMDGKRRSIFLSFFLKSNYKVLLNAKNYYKFLFSPFFKAIFSNTTSSYYKDFILLLKILNFDFQKNDLNSLNDRIFKKSLKDKYGEIVKEKMSIFHFDEKWIFNKYISYYFNIEPSKDELIGFIEKISNKIENRLIITTGIETNELIDKIKIFFKNNNRVKIVDNLDFIDLEYLITHSNLLITCHGAVSHVASAKNIKIIDIIDKNPSNPYNKWTDHFRNYHPIYRKKFMSLSEEILKEINK